MDTVSALCQICKERVKFTAGIPAEFVRPFIVDTIRKEHSDWNETGFICLRDLNHFRSAHIKEILETDDGQLGESEKEVLESIEQQQILTENLNREYENKLSFADRLADRMAAFGGSWKFICAFTFVMFLWIFANGYLYATNAFDPFPFILLNLMLSCLAAIQAPIIMMSQNRQASKDRMRAEIEYEVNLKAELEIRQIKSRIDQLVSHQWQRLLEIQDIQTQFMRELTKKHSPTSEPESPQ